MDKRMKKKKEELEEFETVEVEPVEKSTEPVQEFYILKIGETLKDVSKKFNVSEEKLKQLNGEVFGTNQIKLK